MNIAQFRRENLGLYIEFADGQHHQYSWFWLQDHGEDENSIDLNTQQRTVDTFSLDQDCPAPRVEYSEEQQRVYFRWSEDNETFLSCSRLYESLPRLQASNTQTLWLSDNLPNIEKRIDFSSVMESDAGLLQWLEQIDQYGFAILQNCIATQEATIKLAERIAEGQRTIFGTYWLLSAELDEHEDSAYSTSFLSPHTDGTYYHNAAGLQMFNCLEFDGSGGESTLVDGFAIAEAMRHECPEHFKVLSETIVLGQYIEPHVHLIAERPLIKLDRHGAVEQISFNNYDRAPFILPEPNQSQFYEAYSEFNNRSSDEKNWLKIPLRPGNALIFNNWRCLHGRMGYQGKRVFYGCYHDMAEFQSRLRMLRNNQK